MKIKELYEELKDDGTELPDNVFQAITNEIESLAKDEQQEWASALALVHEAYKVSDVERPTPSMRGGWAQYEKCIEVAVKALSKFRKNGNWRATSATTKVEI